MDVHVVLLCEHEAGPLREAGAWSETASIEGAPLWMREPHRWGNSVSRSGYFQVSVINGAWCPLPGSTSAAPASAARSMRSLGASTNPSIGVVVKPAAVGLCSWF